MTRKPPVEDPQDDDPTVGPPLDHAAGLPAVLSAVRHGVAQMGAGRTALTLLRVNQADGFDCPGCAWPEPDAAHRHVAEFCENGAKAVADEATVRRIDREFFARHPISDLADRSDYWLGQQGRLTEPMVKRPGSDHYHPIDWDEAYDLVARTLTALTSPDQAIFYTSGRTSNEAAFLYQLFVRAFGTNNLPDCSNMCHESSGAALTETIGIGKGSVSLDDIHAADLILVVGQNPGTNHPRMLMALDRAKRAGARIVAVNPLPEAGLGRFDNPQTAAGLLGRGSRLADEFCQIRVNGDLAFFQALGRLLLDAERVAPGTVLDHEFIAEHCHGFEAYAAHLAELSWADVAEATGLTREEIDRVHQLVLGSRRIVVCWAMGLTQHRNSVATIREIVNFLLLRGNIGRPGAGVCPVRGHSNVQGDRTMGINEKPPAVFLDALEREFRFAPPREPGYDVVEAIRAMRDGRASVFFAVGGNFVRATPDTDVTRAALARCALTVQVSTKLNGSHAAVGETALILPTLGRTERDVQVGGAQFVTVEDSMSMVHASRGRLTPAHPALRSEVAIVCELAERVLGGRVAIPWRAFVGDYDLIRDRIAQVVPGFADFNTRVRQPGGFQLPHGPRDSRTFGTAAGRAMFTANRLDVLRVPPGRLILQTLRSHDQYNTTVYGLDDRYRGISGGRRVVFVNPADLAERQLADGAYTDIVSEWPDGAGGVQERRAQRFRIVAYPTARGCAAAYFPEANVLVPLDSTAETSNTPTSKSIVVRLEPAER
ncbi:FdhF/YdeP family oxidoreductase [Micromonospora polyrhachis]|uniref:Molybdopterin-dependent oxidoreductase alpha subunit n=1 Tax=Micromonospora polyrhachis TaxID=1282883 RepID=A0A7W7WSU4_9ACTN|nr:FdhF/YdeP family oxidoreductase [Micromonospora polyrhachis]MBB4961967.1 molybdopterin-dependent oxidoreductase alpha subunit [Micromonospora polyrhachis]